MQLRRLACLGTALAALVSLSGPAWSARVVEMRVGNHPTYTRVVFELDAPAGYRIERRELAGGQQIVVELDAASTSREVKSRSAMVAGVALEPSGADSVAHIQLRGSSPRVKELILGGPPRIVLDIMLPEEKRVRDVTAPPAVAPKRADAAPAPKVAEKPTPPKVAPKTEPSKVAAKPESPKPAETPQPPDATPPATKPADRPIAKVEEALEGERIVEPKPAQVEEPKTAEVASPAPSPAPGEAPAEPPKPAREASPAKPPGVAGRPPSAPAPARPAESKGLFGIDLGDSDNWMTLGLVGGGLLLFLIVTFALLRRHSKPTSLDALEMARESAEPMDTGDIFSTIASVGTKATQATTPTFPVAGPGRFVDEREEKGESEMDVVAELPIERGARAASSLGSDSGLGSLVQELERRMAQLESRLDQANEARERLERQVTAQSEELRVQRAAIARTQRALRGMTRGGDDQATEPALRDPAKPTSGRS